MLDAVWTETALCTSLDVKLCDFLRLCGFCLYPIPTFFSLRHSIYSCVCVHKRSGQFRSHHPRRATSGAKEQRLRNSRGRNQLFGKPLKKSAQKVHKKSDMQVTAHASGMVTTLFFINSPVHSNRTATHLQRDTTVAFNWLLVRFLLRN